MKPLRVLHLDTERGWRGGQHQVYLLHRHLCSMNVDSTVLCRADQPLATKLIEEKLPVLLVRDGLGFPLRAAWAAHHCIRSTPSAILHAHASAAHGIARLAVSGRKNPLLTTRRVDFKLAANAGRGWKYGLRTTHFVAVSRAVAAVLEKSNIPPERISVIHDGIEPPRATKKPSDLPTGRILVLCAAAFAEHKGHRILLDAWRIIEKIGLPASLLLAGRGELENQLRQHAEGLEHVHFLGWREDIVDLWSAVDIAVLASLEEGLGSTLIDAQSAGVPVVATTAGGIPEIVAHEQGGFLVPPGDSTLLAKKLRDLISDQDLRHRLGTCARENAAHFHAQKMAQRYVELYQRISSS